MPFKESVPRPHYLKIENRKKEVWPPLMLVVKSAWTSFEVKMGFVCRILKHADGL
jgi:hypothetical protein